MKTLHRLPVYTAPRTAFMTTVVPALVMLCATTALAQPRLVIVNGEFLDDNGLTAVDTLNCGEMVPDGVYWIDFDASTWGVVGQDIAEPLPDCDSEPAQEAPAGDEPDDCESRYSLWEDRMMYCYGVNPN